MAPPRDWTTGSAKWAAVAVLGSASLGGLYISLFERERGSLAPVVSHAAAQAEGEPAAPTRSSSHALPLTCVIDLNSASAAELDLLPGVGPALAARIIAYRQEHGSFASVDQLDNVKGIGPRTLERLRPLVKVEPPAPSPAPAADPSPP